MERFARIIELPKTQCLLTVEYDDEEDAFKTNVCMVIDGIMATVGLGFHTKEAADQCLKNFTRAMALEMYLATLATINETDPSNN
jgi:nucleoside phosphorylase